MKRTLLEIAAGLGLLVLIASLHRQVDRLQADSREVHRLKTLVSASIEKEPKAGRGAEEIADLARKVKDLEVRVAEASQTGSRATQLEEVLQREQAEHSRFKSQIAQDMTSTRSLMDTYIDELRSTNRRAQSTLEATRSELAQVKGKLEPDHRALTRTMIAPTVQLNGDDTVGSGTLVFSGQNPKDGTVETYVLTAHHVVRNILADTPSARTNGVVVTIYLPDGARKDVRGDMILSEPRIDSALLKLRTTDRFENVARVLPKSAASRVEVWEPIYAVGCPLGNDPVPSAGAISSLKNQLNNSNYWMINAPTYFGNSGGGIYLADTCELVGVFSKIYTHGKGAPVVIPHMGLCTPITTVHEWLATAKLGWILDPRQPDLHASDPSTPPK